LLAAPYADPHVLGVGGQIIPVWQTGRPKWFRRSSTGSLDAVTAVCPLAEPRCPAFVVRSLPCGAGPLSIQVVSMRSSVGSARQRLVARRRRFALAYGVATSTVSTSMSQRRWFGVTCRVPVTHGRTTGRVVTPRAYPGRL
jgi:hypothetical protein